MTDNNSAGNNNSFVSSWMQSQGSDQQNQAGQQNQGDQHSTFDQRPDTSYVDSYQPPQSQSSSDSFAPPAPPAPQTPSEPAVPPVSDTQSNESQASSSGSSSDTIPASQTLEDQNIFTLLGVDGSNEEKEAFLDELQQVIWEDFLDRDVELLITAEEMVGLKAILDKKDMQPEDQQEEVLVYLDKLVPDLEAIMLEKALELKEDMVRERVAGMKEFYAGNQEALGKLSSAEAKMNDGQWKDAADLLNTIK
jgi:hypothetical protein